MKTLAQVEPRTPITNLAVANGVVRNWGVSGMGREWEGASGLQPVRLHRRAAIISAP